MLPKTLTLKSNLRKLIIDEILRVVPRTIAIYIYGSFSKGFIHAESDIDLALLLPVGAKVQWWDLVQLRGDLEAIVDRPVDISILEPQHSLVHSKEVVLGGEVLFCRNEKARMTFEMHALSLYLRFCEERLPIVQAYAA